MKRNQFWTAVCRVLAVMTVTLITALILVPGALAAGKYKILYNFAGGTDGSQPYDAVILDTAGNLYGTTAAGGASGNGTVFKLTKNSDGSWTESVLYSFAGGSDGATPWAGLTVDTSGNLYGTTWYGGASSAGTVFQLVPNSGGTWTENVIYSFTADGQFAPSGAIFDAGGALYGIQTGGGTQGMGFVYKLTPDSDGSWTFGLLHSFTGGQDGSYPLGGDLAFDTTGNLYGATGDDVDAWGDCLSGDNDCGSIFEMTPNSDGTWTEQVIFRFHGARGRKPAGPVTFDSAGRIYSVAQGGGGYYGTAFKLRLGAKGNWNEDVLHVFQGNQDGAYPSGRVVFDATGSLYGTANLGDSSKGCCGQVFKLIPHRRAWSKHTLHWFKGSPDGAYPAAGVVLDAAGNIYGTTWAGGTSGNGVVFEFTP